MVYVWATLLLLANLAAWVSSVFTLPGNWLMLVFTALYAWLLPAGIHPRVSWIVVAVALGLAILGEIVEFVAGAAGAARQGASRRGVVLSIVGAVVGSIAGAVFALPIPIVGPLIGAVAGGAVGAFAGAYLGESGSTRTHAERFAIGRGALLGRLLGTAGKLALGAVMLVVITLDSFFDLAAAE
ncbi:MAG: DUF456 domain-containing protein [Planctomycetes bacterium]|nr:DUF456 domain-containing protein [Planctomycetota bacterium]